MRLKVATDLAAGFAVEEHNDTTLAQRFKEIQRVGFTFAAKREPSREFKSADVLIHFTPQHIRSIEVQELVN